MWERSIWGPDATCRATQRGERIRRWPLAHCNVTTVAYRPRSRSSPAARRDRAAVRRRVHAHQPRLMPTSNEDFVAIARPRGRYSRGLDERIARRVTSTSTRCAKWPRVFMTAHDVRRRAIQMQGRSRLHDSRSHRRASSLTTRRGVCQQSIGTPTSSAARRDGVSRRARDNQVLSTGSTAKKVQEGAGRMPG